MRNVLSCRRGSAAFATVIALVPLIGAMALGGEAASWYVTKQRAQGAADAAAYSGALRLACDKAPQPGVTCSNTQSVDYRGKQVAAQNSFCNSGDTSYPGATCSTSLPQGVSKSVQITTLGSWNGTAGNYVQATISQQQPAYLAQLLGLSTINVVASAVAGVDSLAKPPCVLALKDPVTFQGSANVSSPTCGISSNSTAANAIGFIGNAGISVNAPSYTVGSCSQTGGSQCTGVKTYQQPIPDPLSAVATAMAALSTNDFPNKACSGSTAVSYEAGACYNSGNPTFPSKMSGTYYFTGNVKLNGSPTITGTATLIFFGGASFTVTGTPTIQLTAMTSPTGPSTLSATVKALMTKLLIYDDEAYTKQGVNISGTSTSYFNGTVYVPKTPVTYGGNSSGAPSSGCYQVIAYAVSFTGSTTLDNSGCVGSAGSGSAAEPNIQTVRLVQ
ncbi:pilus assembly protein TadG-related protein [Bradyrhizobium sp. WYCCWR 13022]|uniref:pilus assembly protein TadG-related protein n=1 Tax=unclassified Bradyrhizobium TaxID=2631580 RepID=UPI00263A676E|nr:pilus assembly protein TadG-related protein [Bradyrhizobium sp. WYCCWR 13022]MDN4986786.1 pilus assembly protein TadG-related protein [Bradyrhizobium sp. WYCCWR 13022]